MWCQWRPGDAAEREALGAGVSTAAAVAADQAVVD